MRENHPPVSAANSRRPYRVPGTLALATAWWASVVLAFAVPRPKGEPQFNRDVLPILADNCFACHGADSVGRKGELRLDIREAAIRPAGSGSPAIVPGKVDESELIFRVAAEDPEDAMPPAKTGKRLKPQEVETLRRWIAAGAPYEPHWAFVAPKRIEPPTATQASHPVDRFIQARLRDEGVDPAPQADRATLIRRVSLDLTGLPPSREEVEAFLADTRPDAYERVVDRLLGSVHYGEKWGRWWLDLAHYGDSDGIRLDSLRPDAWRYRQWVVEALNADLPFDQFTIEQLAGDLLPNATVSQRMATGFLRNTISDRQTGNADPELGRVRQIVDRTATTSVVWMGLSMSCAQCHDHKFDPVTQREFFQLYSFFNDADEANIYAPLPGELEKHLAARNAYDTQRAALLAPIAEPLAELQTTWEKKMAWAHDNPGVDHAWARALELLVTGWGRGKGEGQFEGLTIIKMPPQARTADQQERLQDYFLRSGAVVDPDKFKELKVAEVVKQLTALAKTLPPLSRAQAMAQTFEERTTRIHLRGDFRRPGEAVQHGTPAILPPLKVDGKPNRLDLARWLVSPEHPLTARVTVNRLWQELFGRGIVGSSDNIGLRGERPTHPELLDWLATEFIARGWSIKSMLRTLMLSHTYRQSSDVRPELATIDPNNTLLARQARVRLTAENVRDTALAASGLLNRTVGGPSVRPPQPESYTKENTRNKWIADKGDAKYRRGLYIFIQRLTPFAQFTNFDLPGSANACTARERSNTPLQALNLLNDPAFVEAAQALAGRLWQEAPADTLARITHGFLLTLARPPSTAEASRLAHYLAQQKELFEADPDAAAVLAASVPSGASSVETAAWVALASVLLNLDEFITRG